MIKVYQNHFLRSVQDLHDGGYGDCFSACIASILDLPLSEVPVFTTFKEKWFGKVRSWLKDRNLKMLLFRPEWDGGQIIPNTITKPQGWSIASGDSVRGPWRHSVVCFDGDVFHDPHPSGAGLAFTSYTYPDGSMEVFTGVEEYMQLVHYEIPDDCAPEGGFFA